MNTQRSWRHRSICLLVCSFVSVFSSQELRADDRLRGFVLGGGATLSEVESLRDWKVNFIRYPMNWVPADTATVDEYYAWLDNEMTANVDPIVAKAKSIGAKVLLDLHNPPGGYANRDRKPKFRMFTELADVNGKSWQEAFIESWRRIATRYVGETGVWGYELVNEPADLKVIAGVRNWVDLAGATISAIRAIDSEHMLVVNPSFARASRINMLRPLVGHNIAVSILFYEPTAFTEQGLDIYRRTLRYPDVRKGYTKARLEKKLKVARVFSKSTNTRILVHEFGSVYYANGTYQWIRDVVSIFEKFKFDWAYFAFGGTVDVFDVDRPGKFDKRSPTAREVLLKKYLSKNTTF